jgi:voltage-gated potassium channel
MTSPTDAEAPATARLTRYERRTSTLMLVLAFAYIAIYAIEVLATGLNPEALTILTVVGNIIWASFVIDLVIRTFLAPNRWLYLAKHPIDVLAVALPMFRAFRVLRIITAGQWILTRGSHVAIGRTSAAISAGVALVAFVGALAMLDAERNAPSSTIDNFGNAIWWAFVTLSTVGYGDVYPITGTGRAVAVMMMVVGVALLGLVSATLASSLLVRLRGEEKSDQQVLLERIDALETKVDDLTALLRSTAPPEK